MEDCWECTLLQSSSAQSGPRRAGCLQKGTLRGSNQNCTSAACWVRPELKPPERQQSCTRYGCLAASPSAAGCDSTAGPAICGPSELPHSRACHFWASITKHRRALPPCCRLIWQSRKNSPAHANDPAKPQSPISSSHDISARAVISLPAFRFRSGRREHPFLIP